MGRKRNSEGGALFPRYRPEKVSLGVELVQLPPAMPEVSKSKKALQFYEFIGGELIRSQKLATTDIFTLQLYCLELADYLEIRQKVGKTWAVDGYLKNPVINPLCRVMAQKAQTVKEYAKELGLTPHSRGHVGKVTGGQLPTNKAGGDKKDFEDLVLD